MIAPRKPKDPNRPLAERYPDLPVISDRMARIAAHPKNDAEEREVSAAVREVALAIRERLPRPIPKRKRYTYSIPELPTDGLPNAHKNVARYWDVTSFPNNYA